MRTFILSMLISTILLSCKQQSAPNPEYLKEIESWKANRIENLKSENGWLNLSGLFWLEEGENSFGSASDNKIVFPEKAAEYCGVIIQQDSIIEIIANENAGITSSGEAITKMELLTDKSGSPTIIKQASLAWHIIKRGDRYAIRLRDFENPNINKLDSIPSYPVSTDWIIEAQYVAFDSIKKVAVGNMIGGSEDYDVPGKLVFRYDRKNLELLPFKSGKGFFIIIGDETSAVETYAAGRYMYVDAPDENGKVILDFNKAYNPPCAFTPFATCPIPPPENRLEIAITAGEKAVHFD